MGNKTLFKSTLASTAVHAILLLRILSAQPELAEQTLPLLFVVAAGLCTSLWNHATEGPLEWLATWADRSTMLVALVMDLWFCLQFDFSSRAQARLCAGLVLLAAFLFVVSKALPRTAQITLHALSHACITSAHVCIFIFVSQRLVEQSSEASDSESLSSTAPDIVKDTLATLPPTD